VYFLTNVEILKKLGYNKGEKCITLPDEDCGRSLEAAESRRSNIPDWNFGIESFRRQDRNWTDLWKVPPGTPKGQGENLLDFDRISQKLSGLTTEDMLTPSIGWVCVSFFMSLSERFKMNEGLTDWVW
jgi:hypothetical protein